MDEVLEVFNWQTNSDLINIKNAIPKYDIETIQQTTHRMLTMFRQLRAVRVIPLLEKTERYSKENTEIVEMQMDYEKLVLNIRDLQKALKNR